MTSSAIRGFIGISGRAIFYIGFVLILLDAFIYTFLIGDYVLLVVEIIAFPLTYFIHPWFSGLWWLFLLSMGGYIASTVIGGMEPVG